MQSHKYHQSLSKVAISRVVNAFPILTIPPLFLEIFKRSALIQRNPKLLIPINFGMKSITKGLIGASLMITLPYAIALFPQISSIRTCDLEPELQSSKHLSGMAYFNKGL